MAETVKMTCPRCGDVDGRICDMRVLVDDDGDMWATARCTGADLRGCDAIVLRQIPDNVFELLHVDLEVRVLHSHELVRLIGLQLFQQRQIDECRSVQRKHLLEKHGPELPKKDLEKLLAEKLAELPLNGGLQMLLWPSSDWKPRQIEATLGALTGADIDDFAARLASGEITADQFADRH